MSHKPKAIEVNTPYTHEKRQSQAAPHALIPKKNEKENEENEPKCPYASKSQWFVNHPNWCRRCSGDGTILVGGYRPDLEDSARVTCSHCNGTCNDPCYKDQKQVLVIGHTSPVQQQIKNILKDQPLVIIMTNPIEDNWVKRAFLEPKAEKTEKVDEFGPFYSDEMKYMSKEDLQSLRDRWPIEIETDNGFKRKYLEGEWKTEPGFDLIPDNEVKK